MIASIAYSFWNRRHSGIDLISVLLSPLETKAENWSIQTQNSRLLSFTPLSNKPVRLRWTLGPWSGLTYLNLDCLFCRRSNLFFFVNEEATFQMDKLKSEFTVVSRYLQKKTSGFLFTTRELACTWLKEIWLFFFFTF